MDLESPEGPEKTRNTKLEPYHEEILEKGNSLWGKRMIFFINGNVIKGKERLWKYSR